MPSCGSAGAKRRARLALSRSRSTVLNGPGRVRPHPVPIEPYPTGQRRGDLPRGERWMSRPFSALTHRRRDERDPYILSAFDLRPVVAPVCGTPSAPVVCRDEHMRTSTIVGLAVEPAP